MTDSLHEKQTRKTEVLQAKKPKILSNNREGKKSSNGGF